MYDLLSNSSRSVLPTVSGNEMASFGCPWIRRTKRLTLSNTGTFGEYTLKEKIIKSRRKVLKHQIMI